MGTTILKGLTAIVTLVIVSISSLGRSLHLTKPIPYVAEAPPHKSITLAITAAPLPIHTPIPTPTLVVTWAPPPPVVPTIRWGIADKVAEHLYQIHVGQDQTMSTNDELFQALNIYRELHGVPALQTNDDLCRFADIRIKQLTDLGTLDGHKGFKEYLDSEDNWKNLSGLISVGENNSIGYRLTGTHLIEWIFDADEEHRSNQLDARWNQGCVRIQGTIVEVLFGRRG